MITNVLPPFFYGSQCIYFNSSFSALTIVTVGWVIWPVKPVPDMTYNVFGGTLNLNLSL